MPGSRIVRNLLVGRTIIKSRREFKYALLRGQLGMIAMVVAFLYAFMDAFRGPPTFITWNILIALSGLFSLILNRVRYFSSSTILLFLMMNGTVYAFADSGAEVSDYLLFLPVSVITLVLFNYYHRYLGIALALVPILLGTLALKTDLHLIATAGASEGIQEIPFSINFVISTLATTFTVYFLINRNAESEDELKKNEHSLLKLSEELEKSQERFVLALRGTRAGIYEWDLPLNHIHVSNYWKRIMGYDQNELENITIDDFVKMVHPDDAERTADDINRHMESHQPYQNEVQLKTKDGSYKWFLDSGIFKVDSNNNIEKVVGSLIDINDRKIAEEVILLKNEQLAKANEELDRFVYSASHDMRAPLSSLLGLINLAEKSNLTDDMSVYLSMMKNRIHTMEGFIKEVTDYSRNVRLEIVPSDVCLYPVVLEIIQNLADLVTEKKVHVDISIEKDVVLRTDFARLKVILNNLLSNAFKYHRLDQEDSFIVVHAEREKESVILTVKDNGIGIDTKHHTRIFEMFYRAAEGSDGSGLGLYIVKETIQKLGGTIEVESEAGKGSTFTLTLPDRA